MPKDEFDFNDPLELNGVAFFTEEDTTDEMCECFIDEFLWLGHNHKQILALFKNPGYVGPHLVFQKRGEEFVRGKIADTFAQWGKAVAWPTPAGEVEPCPATEAPHAEAIQFPLRSIPPASASHDANEQPTAALTDPLGAPIPQLNL